jgi:tol-pal system protein YbgF
MKLFLSILLKLSIAMVLLPIAIPVFAESAPVYDAEAIDQQFYTRDEQGPYYPPPPSPDQESIFDQPSSSSHEATSFAGASLSMAERVRRVEQQINNMQNNDLLTRLNALQSEVQSLRGQMEQILHEMQQLQNQQKGMYADLDKRMAEREKQNLETSADQTSQSASNAANSNNHLSPKGAAGSEGTQTSSNHKARKGITTTLVATEKEEPATVPGQPNVAEEQKIYQTAYNLIKAKNYNEAVNILQNMLKKYPSGQFASNAHYWLGELYGLMGKNDNALSEFNVVLRSYPKSPRVSDAQLKVGLIYAAEFNWVRAKAAFRRVITHYPNTSSARLASEQLKQIRKAGH